MSSAQAQRCLRACVCVCVSHVSWAHFMQAVQAEEITVHIIPESSTQCATLHQCTSQLPLAPKALTTITERSHSILVGHSRPILLPRIMLQNQILRIVTLIFSSLASCGYGQHGYCGSNCRLLRKHDGLTQQVTPWFLRQISPSVVYTHTPYISRQMRVHARTHVFAHTQTTKKQKQQQPR